MRSVYICWLANFLFSPVNLNLAFILYCPALCYAFYTTAFKHTAAAEQYCTVSSAVFTYHNAFPLKRDPLGYFRYTHEPVLKIWERFLCGNVLDSRAEVDAVFNTICSYREVVPGESPTSL